MVALSSIADEVKIDQQVQNVDFVHASCPALFNISLHHFRELLIKLSKDSRVGLLLSNEVSVALLFVVDLLDVFASPPIAFINHLHEFVIACI